jgi:hypothetical protein
LHTIAACLAVLCLQAKGKLDVGTCLPFCLSTSAGPDVLWRPHYAHRLDLGTGGLLLVGKTRRGLRGLCAAFAERTVWLSVCLSACLAPDVPLPTLTVCLCLFTYGACGAMGPPSLFSPFPFLVEMGSKAAKQRRAECHQAIARPHCHLGAK